MLDLHNIKETFSDLVLSTQPWTLTQFIMWLDIKISEYKVNGYMVLDHDKKTVPKWIDEAIDCSCDVAPKPPPCMQCKVNQISEKKDSSKGNNSSFQQQEHQGRQQSTVSVDLTGVNVDQDLISRSFHKKSRRKSPVVFPVRNQSSADHIDKGLEEHSITKPIARDSQPNCKNIPGQSVASMSQTSSYRDRNSDIISGDNDLHALDEQSDRQTVKPLFMVESCQSLSLASDIQNISSVNSPVTQSSNFTAAKARSKGGSAQRLDILTIEPHTSATESHDSIRSRTPSPALNSKTCIPSYKISINKDFSTETDKGGKSNQEETTVISLDEEEEVDVKPDIRDLAMALSNEGQVSMDQSEEVNLHLNNISMNSDSEVSPADLTTPDQTGSTGSFSMLSDNDLDISQESESQSVFRVSAPVQLPTFNDPFVRTSLESGNAKNVWHKLVAICASHLLTHCGGHPTSSDYQNFSKSLYLQYPSIGMDRGPNPWSVFSKTLSQKIRTTRHQQRTKHRRQLPSTHLNTKIKKWI